MNTRELLIEAATMIDLLAQGKGDGPRLAVELRRHARDLKVTTKENEDADQNTDEEKT